MVYLCFFSALNTFHLILGLLIDQAYFAHISLKPAPHTFLRLPITMPDSWWEANEGINEPKVSGDLPLPKKHLKLMAFLSRDSQVTGPLFPAAGLCGTKVPRWGQLCQLRPAEHLAPSMK